MHQDKSNIAIIIPAYNEERYIGDVIKKCQKYSNNVIVVDDCSTDNTRNIATGLGALCLSQKSNMGWGHAIQVGLKLCRKHFPAAMNYPDIIITLDADGQHNPDEIPVLIDKMNNSDASIVIGSRFMNNGYEIGKIPMYRRFGINVINLIYNFGRKNKLTDTQSGFRAYRNDSSLFIKIDERGFAFSTEKLIKASKCGFKIYEVPVARIYHNDLSENSSMNPIIHGLNVALKTLIWRIRVEFLGENILE